MYRHPISRDLSINFFFIYPGGEPADIRGLAIDIWLHVDRVSPVCLSVYRPAGSVHEPLFLNSSLEGTSSLTARHPARALTPGIIKADLIITGPEGDSLHFSHTLPIELTDGPAYQRPGYGPHPGCGYTRRPYGHPNHIGIDRPDQPPIIFVTVPTQLPVGHDHVTTEQLDAAIASVNSRIDKAHEQDPNNATSEQISAIIGMFGREDNNEVTEIR